VVREPSDSTSGPPAAPIAIPLVDLAAQQREVAEEIASGWARVVERSAFVLGEEVRRFEEAFAAFCGVRHCVGVANGTDALEIALRAVGVSAGDEVILPANSYVASAFAVTRLGAIPVLVDVDPVHLLIDPARVADRVGRRTRAVMPVHLYGQCAPVEDLLPLLPAHVAIVEDASQAQGARRHGRVAGALGAAAAMSFYPSKNLGAYGDAGGVVSDSDEIARAVRVFANQGSEGRDRHVVRGANSRLDTLQAVVLSAKLSRLADWNAARAAAAARYETLLASVPGVRAPAVLPGNEHVWHLYVVRVPRRDDVRAALSGASIGTGVHYPAPIHLQEAFADLGHGRGDFPEAERAADEVLSLPMHPHLSQDQQEEAIRALRLAVR
jgi:dTDP-4-amino-4,6-dideoxygalactose transaminase